jgi:hypothetical protein
LSVEEIRESIGDLIDEYIDQNTRLAAEQISQTGGKKIQSGERLFDLFFLFLETYQGSLSSKWQVKKGDTCELGHIINIKYFTFCNTACLIL